jgi:hypothetical protein
MQAGTRTRIEIPGKRGAPGTRGLDQDPFRFRGLRVLSYRVILDVPLPLVAFVSRLLAAHRREIGTRAGTRALTCWKQAVFALAWFRDRPDIRRLGQGPGISQATAYRYKDEVAGVLAAKAPQPAGCPGEGRRAGASLPDPGRHADLLRPVRGQEDQQEGQGDRQVVLRQGALPCRERAGAGRTRRHHVVGLGRAARQHS